MNTLKSKDGNLAKLAVNKSLLKEYKTSDCDRTVYLNDGDEFQIQLFNSETVEIGIDISIDNESLSNLIILRPGERMWLERYTDKAKKFKFTTYTVDGGSKEVEKAIAHNGEVVIKFYRKRTTPKLFWNNNITYVYPETYVYRSWPNWSQPIYCDYTSTAASALNNVEYTSSATSASNVNAKSFTTGHSDGTRCASGIPTLSRAKSVSDDITLSCCNYSCTLDDIGAQTFGFNDSVNIAASTINPDEIETGRVSEGSYSSQRFETVDIDLEDWAFRTETIKILPMSRKPYTAADTQKIYCPNCGRKLKSKFKYCPFCGEKID